MDKRSTAGKKRQKSITDLFKKPAKNAKVTVQSRAAFNVNTFTLDDFSSDDEDLDVNFSSDESENDL